MVKCSFCGKTIQPGTGITYVKTNGTILHFCSSKCFKNALELGRKPIRVKWTAKHRQLALRAKTSKDTKKKKAKR